MRMCFPFAQPARAGTPPREHRSTLPDRAQLRPIAMRIQYAASVAARSDAAESA